MRYLIIIDKSLPSAERIEKINRELYRISRPNPDPKDVTKYFLGTVEHPTNGLNALCFEDTDYLPVNSEMDVTALKELLEDEATQEEKDQLEMYIRSKIGSTVLFKDIIPSATPIRDAQYMIDNGYIIE